MSAPIPKPELLPRDALIVTSEVDHAEWNHRALLGRLQRKRFELLLSLLPDARPDRLLEIGYGSGVLMPELARRCGELHGIDPHPHPLEVAEVLARHGVRANLASASATSLPFEDDFLDGVVSVSALEYVEDIDAACREIARVSRPGAFLIVVTPGHSPLLDLGLRAATGSDASTEYGQRRQRLVPALTRHFRVEEERRFPPLLGRWIPVYRALRLVTP